MDEKDGLILKILEDNCKTSEQEIADMVDLDATEVAERIAVLEKRGIIRKYTAVIDWDRTGGGQVAAILELKVTPERGFGFDRVAERLARFRQVRSVRLISGVYDLELLVVGTTIHDITGFVAEHVAAIEGIKETGTILIMKTYKENGQMYFDRKEGERLPYSF